MISFLQSFPPTQPSNNIPVTVEGVLLLLLMGLVPFAPRIWEATTKGIEALVARVNTRTEEQVKHLDVFKVLTEEVRHLRAERERDHERIEQAEKKAEEASNRADRFEHELEEERQKRREMKVQVDTMQQQLNTVTSESLAKDEIIKTKTLRNAELEAANADLTAENQTLKSENTVLEHRVAALEAEVQRLTSPTENNHQKNTDAEKGKDLSEAKDT